MADGTKTPPNRNAGDGKGEAISWTHEERDALLPTHPVLAWEHRVRIPTPPLKRVAEVISDCIFRGKAGRFFVGPPRFGKTQTIAYLRAAIAQAFPDIPVIVLEAALSLRPSENAVCGEVLDATGFNLARKKRVDELRNQTVNVLWSIAEGRGDHRIVIFVDEAQHWGVSEWAWLKGLLNRLGKLEVTLLVFPFGQKELDHVGTSLRAAGREDLRQRFLNKRVPVSGIRNAEELREVLAWFDETATFPARGGVSFTRFFFPEAVASGFQLQDEAEALWAAYIAMAPKKALDEVGMEWIRGAVQYAMVEFTELDAPSWRPTSDDWSTAVAASDFAEMHAACRRDR
jgi:hypothetical protein